MNKFSKISVCVPLEQEEAAYGALQSLLPVLPYSDYGEKSVTLNVLLPEKAETGEVISILKKRLGCVARVSVEIIEDYWSGRLHGDFKPLKAGGFMIVPAHLSGKVSPDPGLLSIIIRPGEAFGTGQHETTVLLLEMLTCTKIKGRRVLDVGSGTGILSFAAHLLGAGFVKGVDIDPLALDNAMTNTELNGLEQEGILFVQGSVDTCATDAYDLVIANMITSRLISIAEGMKKFPEGVEFLFSGVSIENEEQFCREYSFLELHGRRVKGEWVAYRGIR